ncbi:MAG: hypothetical protein OXE76_04200 [Alphaproteobacteria bacterium]|nr:hypothetical protein [Alphaproteobacteria bacterium]
MNDEEYLRQDMRMFASQNPHMRDAIYDALKFLDNKPIRTESSACIPIPRFKETSDEVGLYWDKRGVGSCRVFTEILFSGDSYYSYFAVLGDVFGRTLERYSGRRESIHEAWPNDVMSILNNLQWSVPEAVRDDLIKENIVMEA